MKKWWIVILYLFIFIWGLFNRELIIHWVTDNDTSYLYVIFLLSALIATIPIVPFTIFGGLVGVKYGLSVALFINWFGGFSAAIIYYVFSRFILADHFERKINQYKKIKELHSLIERNPFISILILRFIPIIPPIAIHIYSGVSNISFYTYGVASAIGLIPSMFIIAFGGDHLFSDFPQFLFGVVIYVLFVLLVFYIYRLWVKNKIQFAKE